MINIYDEPSSSTTSTQVLIDIDLAKKLTSFVKS
jgi:hypothetical protein